MKSVFLIVVPLVVFVGGIAAVTALALWLGDLTGIPAPLLSFIGGLPVGVLTVASATWAWDVTE